MKTPRATHRAGLAPLELVLVLPILLFVMALMVNMGTAGAWKLRTQINSRQAVWRALEQRTGSKDPRPANWPADAALQVSKASASPVPFDPYAGHPVVRGPVLADPLTGEFLPVLPNNLNMRPSLLDGFARIHRQYPLLRSLPGSSAFRRDHVIFDGTRFQYPSMNLASNTTRRVLSLYPLLLTMRSPDEVEAYHEAALAVAFNPNEPALLPLTGGDPEIYDLTGKRSPNFQPALLSKNDWRMTKIPQVSTRVPDYCEANPGTVRSEKVKRLLRTIRNVPHDVSDYYIGAYSSLIRRLENLDPQPPGTQMQIDQLTAKRDQVQKFKSSLPPRQ